MATTLKVTFAVPSHTVWLATGWVVIVGDVLFVNAAAGVLVALGVHVPLSTTSLLPALAVVVVAMV